MYPWDDDEDYEEDDDIEDDDMMDGQEGEDGQWNGHYGGSTGIDDESENEDGEEDENDENNKEENDDNGEGDGYGEDIGDGYGEDQNPDGELDKKKKTEKDNKQQETDVEAKGSLKERFNKRRKLALIRQNAKKYATVMGILPIGCRPENIRCPGCGEKSIYKSKTLTDMSIFKVFMPLIMGTSMNIYFCMNSAKSCRCSFEHRLCWMSSGPFTPVLKQVPYPLGLLRFQ